MGVLLVAGGLLVGGAVAWFWSRAHTRADLAKRTAETEARAKSLDQARSALEQQVAKAEARLAEAQQSLTAEARLRASAETRAEEVRNALEEEKRLLREATDRLKESFDALASNALKSNNRAFIELAKSAMDGVLKEARGDLGKKQEAIDGLVKPLGESLKQFDVRIQELERARLSAYGGLKQQLESLRATNENLQREAGALVAALKRPHVKGRWGEITLKRVVEVAGMSGYCDFDEQLSVDSEEGRKRPDMVVRLPQGRSIIIDAKVSLTSYIEAYETDDENVRGSKLAAHATAVRAHMRALSSKSYWNQFSDSPDVVVMFLPGESFFSAALEQDHDLMEDGFKAKVIVATPATLIAVLRSVALSWQQQQVAENAQKIWDAGAELYDRIRKFAEHLDGIKRGLDKATGSYNAAIGSWDSRVLPSARRLKELGAAGTSPELPPAVPADTTLRPPAEPDTN
jgi:DNA recombination protein RmuC